MSSSSMYRASSTSLDFSCSTSPSAASRIPSILFTAQARLTAVGLVPSITPAILLTSAVNSSLLVVRRLIAPSAIPMPAATPIAGAPLMTMRFIASATSSYVLHSTYDSSPGSLVWSIITTVFSFHSIVLKEGMYTTYQVLSWIRLEEYRSMPCHQSSLNPNATHSPSIISLWSLNPASTRHLKASSLLLHGIPEIISVPPGASLDLNSPLM